MQHSTGFQIFTSLSCLVDPMSPHFQSLRPVIVLAVLLVGGLNGDAVLAQDVLAQDVLAAAKIADAQSAEFYKTKVKPILIEHCFKCHGDDAAAIKGGLALTSNAAIIEGGDSGSAVDRDSPAESLLLSAIRYEDYEMPPAGKLAAEKIDVLTQWVEQGAKIPADEEKNLDLADHAVPEVNDETKKWWSFQPVQRPDLPEIASTEWPANEIDYFILANLESVSLAPAPPATRQELIRRAYYDLIGLPPTPAQVAAFVADDDPQAYEKLIEQLLASPHYGEKWGRHWLDLVRYAETNSFERDKAKPSVWRYRDYVIRSFNDDKSYDQFLIEQLAGDEIENPTSESIIATGYYRLGQWDDEPADPKQVEYDELDDILGTTTQTMLGLTVNCARCHDHKIDPIPQRDYYRLLSFFENIRRFRNEDDTILKPSSQSVAREQTDAEVTAEREKFEAEVAEFQQKMDAIVAIAKPDFTPVEHEDFKYEMNRMPILKKRVGGLLTERDLRDYGYAKRKWEELTANPPGSIRVLRVSEKGIKPPKSFIQIRGNASSPGEPVSPGFISVLSPPEPQIPEPDAAAVSSGRRLALAKWIASEQNPLAARVMANRIWQYHFGRGLVRTASDFGFQGDLPTHPQLLDWLASELVAKNWSIKSLHRTIMMSRAYRMSSRFDKAAYEMDPLNDRFWRFDMRRLTAEEIRDSILAVNGQLNLEDMYGPSIFPIQPKEVLAGQSRPGSGWGKSSPEGLRRRSIYVHVKRSLPVPILSTNDSADTDFTCPVRFITTQPTQALGMINSEFTNHQASLFATDIAANHTTVVDQVSAVLHRVTQRQPAAEEVEQGVALIEKLTIEESMEPQQALTTFCLLAINLNEFVFLD